MAQPQQEPRLTDFFKSESQGTNRVHTCLKCNHQFKGALQRCFAHGLKRARSGVSACKATWLPSEVQALESLEQQHTSDRAEQQANAAAAGEEAAEIAINLGVAAAKEDRPALPGNMKQSKLWFPGLPALQKAAALSISMFACASAIPFKAMSSAMFRQMCTNLVKLGHAAALAGVKPDAAFTPPSYHELRNSLLDETVTAVDNAVVLMTSGLAITGCSVVSDGWTDVAGHPLLNYLAVGPEGAQFLYAVNTEGQVKDAVYLYQCTEQAIQRVGAQHVVCVITDSASTCEAAGALIEEEFPHIFWVRCGAHAMDLILSDIAAADWVKSHLRGARRFVIFIRNHHWTRALLKKHSTLVLCKPGETRFATNHIMADRLQEVKPKLKNMVADPEWDENCARVAYRVRVHAARRLVQSRQFWLRNKRFLNVCKPLVQLLREMDGNGPALSKVYTRMLQLELSMAALPAGVMTNQIKNTIQKVLADRWLWWHSPIHGLAFLLDPTNRPTVLALRELSFQTDENSPAPDIVKNVTVTRARELIADLDKDRDTVISRVLSTPNAVKAIDQLTNHYLKDGSDKFTTLARHEAATAVVGHKWWESYGSKVPELRNVAVRVLAQPASSSAAERNWSDYSYVHDKTRNRLTPQRAEALVSVFSNLRLLSKRARRAKSTIVGSQPLSWLAAAAAAEADDSDSGPSDAEEDGDTGVDEDFSDRNSSDSDSTQ